MRRGKEAAVAPAGRMPLVRCRRWCPGPARGEEEVDEARKGGGVEPAHLSTEEAEQARRQSPRPTSGGDGRGQACRL
jgi:hypothetical protein